MLAALGARHGGDIEAIYRRIPDPADRRQGYSVPEMQRQAERLGFKLLLAAPELRKGNCSNHAVIRAYYQQLKEVVDDGHPIVVPVVSGPSSGHYLILVSTVATGFYVHDPASRGLRKMSASRLAAKMCRYGFVALIVD